MKIFREKNGKEIVYLQLTDLDFIDECYSTMIHAIMHEGIIEKNEFVRFENPNTVQFIKKIDAIIDYNTYESLSLEELEELIDNIDIRLNNIYKFINNLTGDAIYQNLKMFAECKNLSYQKQGIELVAKIKKGKASIILPNCYPTNEGSVKKM